jgi:hypothetical protein
MRIRYGSPGYEWPTTIVAMACVDFELKEDIDGLGGCKKVNTIKELLKENL